jgi:hypothetical protein
MNDEAHTGGEAGSLLQELNPWQESIFHELRDAVDRGKARLLVDVPDMVTRTLVSRALLAHVIKDAGPQCGTLCIANYMRNWESLAFVDIEDIYKSAPRDALRHSAPYWKPVAKISKLMIINSLWIPPECSNACAGVFDYVFSQLSDTGSIVVLSAGGVLDSFIRELGGGEQFQHMEFAPPQGTGY